MTVGTLLFSWNGRCARRPYWAGIVVIEIAIIVCADAAGADGPGSRRDVLLTTLDLRLSAHLHSDQTVP